MRKMTYGSRGNILFLILLAVVLFAALSIAVTSALRSGGKDSTTENADSAAASINNFLVDMSLFVQRAQLVDKVGDADFTFQVHSSAGSTSNYLLGNDNANTWNNNSNCSSSVCRVFKPFNPNGINAQRFEQYADSNSNNAAIAKSGHIMLNNLIIEDVGTAAPELIVTIWHIKPEICNAFNRINGLTTNYTTSTRWTSIGETYLTSRALLITSTSPPSFSNTNVFGEEATEFAGRQSFCAPLSNDGFIPTGASDLGIYHVLIAR